MRVYIGNIFKVRDAIVQFVVESPASLSPDETRDTN